MADRPRTSAEAFLDSNRSLREARDRSAVWPRIKTGAAIDVGGRELYIAGGDTLGGEDELYVDRLARGAKGSGSDELSRSLYLELPADLQAIVRRELLREPQPLAAIDTDREENK